MYVCVCVCMYMYMCMYMCVCMCMYMCIYVCMYMYIYVYVYVYIWHVSETFERLETYCATTTKRKKNWVSEWMYTLLWRNACFLNKHYKKTTTTKNSANCSPQSQYNSTNCSLHTNAWLYYVVTGYQPRCPYSSSTHSHMYTLISL